MLLLEFTGLPGSGKSFLLPYIKKFIKGKGLKVYDRKTLIFATSDTISSRILFYIYMFSSKRIKDFLSAYLYKTSKIKEKSFAAFIINNWQLFDFVMTDIRHSKFAAKKKNLITSWFVNLFSYYQMGKDFLNKNDILIFDEGFFHKVINLYNNPDENRVDYNQLEKYLQNIPHINLINIYADMDVCKKRLTNRKLPRFIQGRSETVINRFLLNTKEIIDYSQNILKNDGNEIFTLDNSNLTFNRSKFNIEFEKLYVKLQENINVDSQ